MFKLSEIVSQKNQEHRHEKESKHIITNEQLSIQPI